MFSKKDYKHARTLSFRLTIWYTVMFSLTSLAALSVFYYHIATVTMKNLDTKLLAEAHEFTLFMDRGGIAKVREEIVYEAAEEDGVFFRLLSADGKILKTLNMEGFGPVSVSREAIAALSLRDRSVIETVPNPGHKAEIRTIYASLGPGYVFNMGISLKDNEAFLSVFRNLIILLMIPLFMLATAIGWLLARHALKGVEEVTQTAEKISNGSIEKRVTVRQRSLEIDQLANMFNHMLDRIQELIKSIREMNDNIAHDLRSPLTRIRGIAEMTLINKESIEDYREMAASTIEECDNLIDIINTMLEITETEAGVNSIETRPIDIVGLIVSTCDLFEPVAQEKEVQITTALPEELIINSNKHMLQRLVTNLLENAIKYNRPGGNVTISAEKQDDQVQIKFADTGKGIAEEDIPKIFERFYRGEKVRSEAGIGLGLTLAKAIALALGGDIRVTSVLNKGSSFSLSLPA